MDLNEIKKLIKVFENSNVSELSIKEGELKIRLSKNGSSNSSNFVQHSVPFQNASVLNKTETIAAEPKSEDKQPIKDNHHIIKSPIVGTFYRAPAPDADQYVKVGDQVNSGSVLCIVEAMKLMNEIECDVDGVLVQVLVEDGSPVEYNQPLFKIEKS